MAEKAELHSKVKSNACQPSSCCTLRVSGMQSVHYVECSVVVIVLEPKEGAGEIKLEKRIE